jgi:hypothetical protein
MKGGTATTTALSSAFAGEIRKQDLVNPHPKMFIWIIVKIGLSASCVDYIL